jgi:hypothetical protein
MLPLTEATWQHIRTLFPEAEQPDVANLLQDRCGSNLPFCHDTTPEKSERIRFAVLKLSEGKLEKLQEMVALACKDWRDVLMASGFGHDIAAHQSWIPD